MTQSYNYRPLEPVAITKVPIAAKDLRQRRYINPYYRDGHIQRDGWLRPDLYALVKPPKGVPVVTDSRRVKQVDSLNSSATHVIWWETIYPAILNLSKSEYDMFVQSVFPDVDPTYLIRYKAPKECKKGDVGPRRWWKLPQRIPDVVPTAREAQIPWDVARLIGAFLHLAALYERGQLNIVKLKASYREVASVIGVAHNNLITTVREKGIRTQSVVPVHVAHPSQGADKCGKNKDGSRRHSPAHPSNEYLLYVCDTALEWARKFRDQHGVPEKPISYEEIELPMSIDPVAQKVAKQKWEQLQQELWNSGLRTDRVKVLMKHFGRVQPLLWDHQTGTLVLQGIITPAIVQILESRDFCRLRFLLSVGTHIT